MCYTLERWESKLSDDTTITEENQFVERLTRNEERERNCDIGRAIQCNKRRDKMR